MLRTLLTLKHYDRDGQLLAVHRDWSRSFTKHFIEGLYLHHAQIDRTVPLTVADVTGSTARVVDGDSRNLSSSYSIQKSAMQICGPTGDGSLPIYSGCADTAGDMPSYRGTFRQGHSIGIVIGRSNTAVTPTDVRLTDQIAHGRKGSNAGPVLIDTFTNDNGDKSYTTTNGYIGMFYRPLRTCLMATIQFKCFRSGTPGNVTAQVFGICSYNNNANVTIDASPIATSNIVNANAWGAASPGAMITFTFASAVLLLAGHDYFIGINPAQASGGNFVNIRANTGPVPTNNTQTQIATAYTTSIGGYPSNAPAVFEIDGGYGAEMEYGGTDVYGYTVADPTATFTLRRIFMNNSGESITVQESGIYLPLCRYAFAGTNSNEGDYNNFIVCAAHDVFGGIAVNNGESLEVDYTPSIHV